MEQIRSFQFGEGMFFACGIFDSECFIQNVEGRLMRCSTFLDADFAFYCCARGNMQRKAFLISIENAFSVSENKTFCGMVQARPTVC